MRLTALAALALGEKGGSQVAQPTHHLGLDEPSETIRAQGLSGGLNGVLRTLPSIIGPPINAWQEQVEPPNRFFVPKHEALKMGSTTCPVSPPKEAIDWISNNLNFDLTQNKLFEFCRSENLNLPDGLKAEDIINTLLNEGADVEAKDVYGWTALMLAERVGDPEVVEVLLKAGADVNAKNDILDGVMAMFLIGATVNYLRTVVKYVRAINDHWISGTLKSDLPQDKLFEFCCIKYLNLPYGVKAEYIINTLLSEGADVNAKNRSGNTPLMEAADAGHTGVVEVLLKAGADVDAKNDYRNTALMLAIVNGKEGVVDLLQAVKENEMKPYNEIPESDLLVADLALRDFMKTRRFNQVVNAVLKGTSYDYEPLTDFLAGVGNKLRVVRRVLERMPKEQRDSLPINCETELATVFDHVANSGLLTREDCSNLRVTHNTGIPNQNLSLEQLVQFIKEQRDAAASSGGGGASANQ